MDGNWQRPIVTRALTKSHQGKVFDYGERLQQCSGHVPNLLFGLRCLVDFRDQIAKPIADCSERDKTLVVGGGLVVARGDVATHLQSANSLFYNIEFPGKFLVVVDRHSAMAAQPFIVAPVHQQCLSHQPPTVPPVRSVHATMLDRPDPVPSRETSGAKTHGGSRVALPLVDFLCIREN